jgi:rare lipoprotein A
MNPGALTAAHRTLPFGTRVSVVNKRNGKSVIVRITDRGPFVSGRIIDLTPAGARAIGVSGLAPVQLTIVGNAHS